MGFAAHGQRQALDGFRVDGQNRLVGVIRIAVAGSQLAQLVFHAVYGGRAGQAHIVIGAGKLAADFHLPYGRFAVVVQALRAHDGGRRVKAVTAQRVRVGVPFNQLIPREIANGIIQRLRGFVVQRARAVRGFLIPVRVPVVVRATDECDFVVRAGQHDALRAFAQRRQRFLHEQVGELLVKGRLKVGFHRVHNAFARGHAQVVRVRHVVFVSLGQRYFAAVVQRDLHGQRRLGQSVVAVLHAAVQTASRLQRGYRVGHGRGVILIQPEAVVAVQRPAVVGFRNGVFVSKVRPCDRADVVRREGCGGKRALRFRHGVFVADVACNERNAQIQNQHRCQRTGQNDQLLSPFHLRFLLIITTAPTAINAAGITPTSRIDQRRLSAALTVR